MAPRPLRALFRASVLGVLGCALIACHAEAPSANAPSGQGGTPGAAASVQGAGGASASGQGGSEASSGEGGPSVTATSAGGQGGSESLPPMEMPAFLVGYNEAWFAGHFGTDLTKDFDPVYVDQVMDGIAAGGGHLVRIWLFEVLQGISLGATPPQTKGVSPELLANLGKVIHAARVRGLWVYVTMLEGNEMSKVAEKPYYKRLLNNESGEGDAFNASVVAPMLTVLDAHKDNVFGVDLVNEIDAPRKDGMWPGYPLDPSAPRAFIKRTRDFIKSKSPWVRVTATMGLGGTAQYDVGQGFLSGLGLDFYDVHIYSDSGSFGGATALCDRAKADGVPVYLGEFGQKTKVTDDALQTKATAGFLGGVTKLCFKGAFAWRYDSAEAYWAFALPGGGSRPATDVMKLFGGK